MSDNTTELIDWETLEKAGYRFRLIDETKPALNVPNWMNWQTIAIHAPNGWQYHVETDVTHAYHDAMEIASAHYREQELLAKLREQNGDNK